MERTFDPDDLIRLFNRTFRDSHNTILVRGGDEPLYLPADEHHPHHRVLFAHGYFSSALHEIAHWTIAGSRRRTLVDYGYWYQPDGRDARRQAEFERVERKPQAIEWAFHIVCGKRFHVSMDNLSGSPGDMHRFERMVERRLRHCFENRFPPRAERFIEVLSTFYGHAFRLQDTMPSAVPACNAVSHGQ